MNTCSKNKTKKQKKKRKKERKKRKGKETNERLFSDKTLDSKGGLHQICMACIVRHEMVSDRKETKDRSEERKVIKQNITK